MSDIGCDTGGERVKAVSFDRFSLSRAPGILIAWPPTFLESSAFSLGFERPRRTGRDASSAEVHGPRELASRLPPPFEVLIGRKEEPDDAAKA